MQKLESQWNIMVPIAIINMVKEKKEQRRGLERGSAAQLPSTLTTELRTAADKMSSLQDIWNYREERVK
jgi:hypothetical protein